MSRRAVVSSALLAAALFAACGPEENTGTVHHVTLSPDSSVPKEAGTEEDAGDEDVYVEPPGPPMVEEMSPLAGPYGTEIRIVGEDLGSLTREGVSLSIGTDPVLVLEPDSYPEIVYWMESEIRFRFPFPYSGPVVLTTPEGTVDVGEFEPTWIPGERLEAPAGVKSIASIANEPGRISAVIDTTPPRLVEFDGTSWSTTDVTTASLRTETIRLYRDGAALAAFGLSTATSPEILALDPSDDFAATPTGVNGTSKYILAGGKEGAVVWFTDDSTWSRARPADGVWAYDTGTIADPNPGALKHTAGTTSDGSLFVGWAENDGTALDDWGVPYFRRLLPDDTIFLAKTRAGNNIDDSVSSYSMPGRGSGVVARYCGTDKDPLGVTGNEVVCYAALLPAGIRATAPESTGMRYAFTGGTPVAAYCDPSKGVRIIPDIGAGKTTASAFGSVPGEIVTWPCLPIVALEVDDDGVLLVILEYDGALYSPRPRAP